MWEHLPEPVLEHMQAPYDPAKRHAYYLQKRQLKGRQKGAQEASGDSMGKVIPIKKAPRVAAANQAASEARVGAIRDRLATLRDALQKALAEKTSSSSTSSTDSPSTKSNPSSDKPMTSKEKADAREASQKFRDTHKQDTPDKPKQIADMSVDELRSTIKRVESNLRAALQQARTQTASNGR